MQKAEIRPKNDNKPLHLSGRRTGLDNVPFYSGHKVNGTVRPDSGNIFQFVQEET